MNTQYDVLQMKSAFRPFSATGSAQRIDLSPIDPDPEFEELLGRSGIWCYSIDYSTGRYRYLSRGIERLLGYDHQEWQFGGLQSVFRHLHPDDRECLRKIHQEISRELGRHPVAERDDLVFVYTCRMITADGSVIHLNHHVTFTSFDAAGHPLTDFVVVSDITAMNAPTACLLHIKQRTPAGDKSRQTTLYRCNAPIQVSPRELEVLKLVDKGLSSQKIADRLFISYNTVCTHRKNLLRKTGAKTTVKLLQYARKGGLLE
ncbi:DNA-binding CsgD family transcriptional regulator [Lewinella aquimaris]|uniref:DNA-binding CsgD family transcriptional regulator n=1 Tax=Neolewinella aquimaris TaxID=1835722 RepID=A0A840E9X0_9BACT|nr:LuxR C-terminal-related transcriptional regulator [Neolewinella aquimaris]MBB4080522.1 DNA-binding CsgD family transcriptional regulator [Neolewinella aquimaris]